MGQGAWGEVWRAQRGVYSLAVKVLRPEAAATPRGRAFLEDEIRAMARLDHPAVVPLLDYGRVPDDAPEGLWPGSPYLVMPLAVGSLDARPPLEDVGEWLAIAETLLAGLAHLHARGFVHRDVKPANVLVFRRPDRYALADLGIAWDPELPGPDRAGTPRYMAPEQSAGAWREFGPWTDLFALGRLLRELATGDVNGGFSRFELPAGADDWLNQLTAEEPRERFPDAAAARRALGAAPHVGSGAMPPMYHLGQGSGVSTAALSHSDEAATWQTVADDVSEAETTASKGPGRGLEGLSLREPPLTGREAIGQTLWEAVRGLSQGRSPFVVLFGEAGVGTSRLARWLCERVSEAGVAPVWRLSGTGVEGLRASIARRFGATDLHGPALQAHLERIGAPKGLGELLDGDSLGPAARADRLLAVLTQEVTPPLLWLDDVDGSDDVAALVDLWVARAEPPAMFLLTSRQPPRWAEAQALPVLPLPARDIADLLDTWLGLTPDLAHRVAGKAAGNVLLASQLVGELQRTAALVAGPMGIGLPPGAPLRLPASVHELWQSRIAALGLTMAEWKVLGAAAVLCEPVDGEIWAAVALTEPIDVRRRLLDAGLAQIDGAGLRFVHPLVREVILGEIDVKPLHARAAAVLQARNGDPGEIGRHLAQAGQPEAALEPLAQACREAMSRGDRMRGRVLADLALVCAESLPPKHPGLPRALWLAGRSRQGMGQFAEAKPILERTMVAAWAVEEWRYLGYGAYSYADALNQAGDKARSERALALSEAAFRRVDEWRGLAYTLAGRGSLEMRTDSQKAAETLKEALVVARRSGEVQAEVAAWLQLGASMPGRTTAESHEALNEALALDPVSVVAFQGKAGLAAAEGDLVEARRWLEESLVLCERNGASADRVGGNLIQVYARLGLLPLAREFAERWIPRTRRSGRRMVLGDMLAASAATALLQGDGPAFDGWAAEAERVWADTQRADPGLEPLLVLAEAATDDPGRLTQLARLMAVAKNGGKPVREG